MTLALPGACTCALLCTLLCTVCLPGPATAAELEQPLSFGFIADVPGKLIDVGGSRLHLDCRGGSGAGTLTILFEPGLGGNALEWQPVRERLTGRLDAGAAGAAGTSVRLCSYDRAGYAWSDPVSGPRDAAWLARDLDTLLKRGGIDAPLVIVAHSFGGFVARLFTGLQHGDVAALVLVDTSHEQQFERLASPGARRMLPGSGQFVLSMPASPDNLPHDLKRKIDAFLRMRKTYAATHGEMSRFAVSAEQVRTARQARAVAWNMPLVVLRRGRRLYADDESGRAKDGGWAELQENLALLSTRGRTVIAADSGHHVHVDQPDLVAEVIQRVLVEVRGLADRRDPADRDGPAEGLRLLEAGEYRPHEGTGAGDAVPVSPESGIGPGSERERPRARKDP